MHTHTHAHAHIDKDRQTHAYAHTHTYTNTDCYLFSLLRCHGCPLALIFKHYTYNTHSLRMLQSFHHLLLLRSSSPGPPGMTNRPLFPTARGLNRPLATATTGGRPVNELR